jgi:hypothetical protein
MSDWRYRLEQLVSYYQAHDRFIEPFFHFDPRQPDGAAWPAELPTHAPLADFYARCGQGEVGPGVLFVPLAELASTTREWIDNLKDYDARGDVLFAGRHIVFATDGAGVPWVLDVHSGEVASFYPRGGGWEEPRYPSFDAFMNNLFDGPTRHEQWRQVRNAVRGTVD